MSGGANKKKATRSQGWEEAGAEFYSESYPMDGESVEVLHRDPKYLATLLPSKQTRAAAATIRLRTFDHRTAGRTLRREASRQESTVNRRTSVPEDVQVSMLPDLSENLSNEQLSEQLAQIKAMPVPMAEKKELKKNIQSKPKIRLQGYEQFKWKRRKIWHQFEARIRESYDKMEIWRKDLKRIEGHFGTGVVAYFLFLKWLVFLNFSIFFIIFLFITLPTIIYEDDGTQNNCTDNTEKCCAATYFNQSIDESNIFLDIIQGRGPLERTVLFYGNYSHVTLDFGTKSSPMYYNLPLAYICVTITYFLISLIAIIRSAAKGFKERLVEGEGQLYHYCNLIFGGWDFCIQNQKSANIKHKAIYNEIKVTLESTRLEEERQGRSRNEKYKIIISRVIVNIIVLGILAAAGYAIYEIFEVSTQNLESITEEISNSTNPEDTNLKARQFFFEFLPSLCIVCLNIVVPVMFRFLINFENYGPLIVIRLTIFRTVLLRLASLAMLFASLRAKIANGFNGDGCPNDDVPICWETYVGQQIFKLMITDFATHIVVTFIVNFFRAFLANHTENKFFRLVGEQSFDLPKHVLDVVYSQTLCWFGLFYAPLLSALASIVFFFMFYIKKFACLVNSKPSTIVYRASRSNSMFMLVLLISYAFALIPIVYSLSELTPSKGCGPFRGLSSIWSFIVNCLKDSPDWIRTIGFFISTAGFVIPLFVLLFLLLYYYSAVNSANRHMVIVLKNQLVLEGHDKQFLLDRLSMFLKQENQKRMRHAEVMRDGDRNISSN